MHLSLLKKQMKPSKPLEQRLREDHGCRDDVSWCSADNGVMPTPRYRNGERNYAEDNKRRIESDSDSERSSLGGGEAVQLSYSWAGSIGAGVFEKALVEECDASSASRNRYRYRYIFRYRNRDRDRDRNRIRKYFLRLAVLAIATTTS